MKLAIIRWRGLYYTGYCDVEGTMWCSVKGSARLLNEEEVSRAIKVIPITTPVSEKDLQLVPVDENYRKA